MSCPAWPRGQVGPLSPVACAAVGDSRCNGMTSYTGRTTQRLASALASKQHGLQGVG